MNKKNISFLVVEKSANPLDDEQAHHDISKIVYTFREAGYSADLVWTLSRWRFDNFEGFSQYVVRELEAKLRKYSKRKDGLRESFERMAREDIEEFRKMRDLLRKNPIRSVDDLRDYSILILHPDFEDCQIAFPQIIQKCPNKPIILPSSSVVSGNVASSKRVFPIANVSKDASQEIYCIQDCRFIGATLELIEHLQGQGLLEKSL